MRNIILIACIVLIVLLCGCSSSKSSPTATPTSATSPAATAAASQGPAPTEPPIADAPHRTTDDPASYQVDILWGFTPNLHITVGTPIGDLTRLVIWYTPGDMPGEAKTSRIVDGIWLVPGANINLGSIADSTEVNVIGTFKDGASRSLLRLRQIPNDPYGHWESY